jgi:hypothetical protein
MNDSRFELLRQAVETVGNQGIVGRRLGYSATTISQALNGKYGGSLNTLLSKVEEIYGKTVINCPVLGGILFGRCAAQRRKPFSAVNHLSVSLFKVCKQCINNHD